MRLLALLLLLPLTLACGTDPPYLFRHGIQSPDTKASGWMYLGDESTYTLKGYISCFQARCPAHRLRGRLLITKASGATCLDGTFDVDLGVHPSTRALMKVDGGEIGGPGEYQWHVELFEAGKPGEPHRIQIDLDGEANFLAKHSF